MGSHDTVGEHSLVYHGTLLKPLAIAVDAQYRGLLSGLKGS